MTTRMRAHPNFVRKRMRLNPPQPDFDRQLQNQKEITLMSTQEQLHSGRRSKIKRGFALSVLTTLVFVTTVSSTARADEKE